VARVIAGEAGGRRLAVPDGRNTRPTSDRAREGLFATISSIAGPLSGLRVMDLYAGSGAVGIEALSRGAAHVLLVESAAPALRIIRANVEAVGLPGAEVAADRVERLLARAPGSARARESAPARESARAPESAPARGYDVVFADPPYALPAAEVTRVLELLATHGWLAPQALVVIERATRDGELTWPSGYLPDRARRYGEATFWYGLAPRDVR
jgi:16S rRNA (guanine966-N2)-methyltransferase